MPGLSPAAALAKIKPGSTMDELKALAREVSAQPENADVILYTGVSDAARRACQQSTGYSLIDDTERAEFLSSEAFMLAVARAAGITEPDPILYLDEVGPALMRVRLLASGPVRGAALAVHVLFEDMHGQRLTPQPGREPEPHFLEVLGHIPLVMHEFEVAVRDDPD